MRKLIAPLIAGFALALAMGPALAGPGGCLGTSQTAQGQGPVSSPVDTASTKGNDGSS